ncbi:zinc finger and SCAN domain-containing protein 31 [Drosophila biarmipes]|uniref:zinc finger and SCAN domain-containing protein 31 n=1 Tax=Drosophila biarmipes TaxID=125945 RepID=UPI0007E68C7F|nr:zinc finger and SCAN domain-containing protein 31 [Drosophila biarmipes]XP_050744299.1 zinc finger and SCAN domain-containing protein 31 [Drosophila biarmipes]
MNASSLPVVLMKCRICLGDFEEGTMSSLFEDSAEGEDALNERVEFCCGIKVRQSSAMPEKACSSCTEFVQMWFNFRQMCLNSQVYWETTCPDLERPEALAQASDAEYMEYLYQTLQLHLSPEKNSSEEIDQAEEQEGQLEDQSQDLIDGIIINEPIEEENEPIKENSEQVLISHLDYVDDPEMEEIIEDKGELVEDLSLLNDEFYEIDYEQEEINEGEYHSLTPSPDLSTESNKRQLGRPRKAVNRRTGRPRKPDHELKFKRREAKPKATKDDDQFMCNLCGNVYTKKSVFTAHMVTHTEYKPHQCEICTKSFRQMGELRAHIRRHTGERPYKCMYCERHFYDRSERVRHERVHTNTRPYACQECGKTFTHTAILKNHMLVHSGEKNYNCDVCSKSFTLLHQLKAHLLTLTHRTKMEQAVSRAAEFMQS